jgi:2-(1,2-epoxy-1,2-dihydrophenyl)acetyl-CoA isomerase
VLRLYSAAPAGYPGNDDLGQLSSWYVFGALGLYPEIPGVGVLALGSPLFGSARVRLGTGKDLLITGAGRGFSSGADLKNEGTGDIADDGMPDVRKRLKELYHPILLGLRELPKPVVAAVNGPAVGIGASLAFACDLIVASSSAYFNLAFVNIGLMPDGGSTAFVPAAVGKARAFQMALLGERIPAQQALDWGLINKVVEPESLSKESLDLATRLAKGPTRSYAGSKRALNQMVYGDLNAQLELEADIQHELFRTNDVREGVTSFVEKRDPAFTGS